LAVCIISLVSPNYSLPNKLINMRSIKGFNNNNNRNNKHHHQAIAITTINIPINQPIIITNIKTIIYTQQQQQ